MKAKINVELYNEDKSNYAPVFPIDPEDKRACRGTRRRRFATWQPLMKYGSSPAFTFRDVVYTGGSIDKYLGYRPVWCVPADSLGQLFAESALCVPNLPEKLCFFETDDYFQIDKPRWKRFDKQRRPEDKIEDFFCPPQDERCAEYIVREIPADAVVFNLMSPNGATEQGPFGSLPEEIRSPLLLQYRQYFKACGEKLGATMAYRHQFLWQHLFDTGLKDLFTCTVLPAAYMCWRMLQQNDSSSVLNGLCSDETSDLLIHVMAGCKFRPATLYKARQWFVDWCGGTALAFDLPAYLEKYGELADYEKNFIEIYNLYADELGLNRFRLPDGPCFCGSGKWFRECHMGRVSELL